MAFTLTILGSSSALPTAHTNPTSHFLNIDEKYFLVDCGEGTQMQLRRNRIKMQRINHIFITHLHGDHYFGLIGLITTMQLLGRKNALHIYSPPGLKAIIEIQLRSPYPEANNEGPESGTDYPLLFHELNTKQHQLIYEDEKLSVFTLPLKHRIPCCGFLFKEKPKPKNLIKDMIGKYPMDFERIQKIKSGEDLVLEDGTVVKNETLTKEALPSFSYAFCSDTQYNEKIIPYIEGVDMLYHEATFLHEMEEQAKKTAHSTALQAGMIAKSARVKQLVIGHFSARYKNPDVLLKEAQSVFENTLLAEEGKKYVIGK